MIATNNDTAAIDTWITWRTTATTDSTPTDYADTSSDWQTQYVYETIQYAIDQTLLLYKDKINKPQQCIAKLQDTKYKQVIPKRILRMHKRPFNKN
jgi:hypothetical protein